MNLAELFDEEEPDEPDLAARVTELERSVQILTRQFVLLWRTLEENLEDTSNFSIIGGIEPDDAYKSREAKRITPL